MSGQYWVVQHVSDLFRNEPRNVGVIVRCEGTTLARFYGEDADHRIDGGRIEGLPYPDVYRQWVVFWRAHLDEIEYLINATRHHYRIAPAGHLTSIRPHQGASYICDYLYSVLVSEGGIAEALGCRDVG